MHDPQSFITLQERLGQNDALNEYISHKGSAALRGPARRRRSGGYIGEQLFA